MKMITKTLPAATATFRRLKRSEKIQEDAVAFIDLLRATEYFAKF